MNEKIMKSNFQGIVDALADDIYEGWIMSALDGSKEDSTDCLYHRDGALRKLAEEAAVTAIGFSAALCEEAVLQTKLNIKKQTT